jgi:hypothetical protein
VTWPIGRWAALSLGIILWWHGLPFSLDWAQIRLRLGLLPAVGSPRPGPLTWVNIPRAGFTFSRWKSPKTGEIFRFLPRSPSARCYPAIRFPAGMFSVSVGLDWSYSKTLGPVYFETRVSRASSHGLGPNPPMSRHKQADAVALRKKTSETTAPREQGLRAGVGGALVVRSWEAADSERGDVKSIGWEFSWARKKLRRKTSRGRRNQSRRPGLAETDQRRSQIWVATDYFTVMCQNLLSSLKSSHSHACLY